MSKRKIFLIALAVIAVHGLGIWAIANIPLSRKETVQRPKDEFRQRTITYVDPAGVPQRVVTEYIVSTRLTGDAPIDESPAPAPVARP